MQFKTDSIEIESAGHTNVQLPRVNLAIDQWLRAHPRLLTVTHSITKLGNQDVYSQTFLVSFLYTEEAVSE